MKEVHPLIVDDVDDVDVWWFIIVYISLFLNSPFFLCLAFTNRRFTTWTKWSGVGAGRSLKRPALQMHQYYWRIDASCTRVFTGVGKCPVLGIWHITFKVYLLEINPEYIVGWCLIGTVTNPWFMFATQCHKPTIWGWFIEAINMRLGDGFPMFWWYFIIGVATLYIFWRVFDAHPKKNTLHIFCRLL